MDTASEEARDVWKGLGNWKEVYLERSRLYYEFSDVWDRFEETMWADYASLDSRREALSLARRPWQTEMETERDELRKYRARLYKPWDGEMMRFCPLWLCLDRNDTSPREHEHVEYPWQAALSNWRLFENCYDESAEFRRRLSPSQRDSFELLRDWWDARYCSKSLVEKTKAYMERLSKHPWPPSETRPDSHKVLKGADLAAMDNKARYEYLCFKLFVTEFHPDVWSPFVARVNVNTVVFARRYATQCAIAQRLSYPLLRGPPESATPERSQPGYPKLSLAPIAPSEGRPYYLWDTEDCQTVETHRLADHPDYACISHTWGRWVDRTKPPFKIPGVPWPVPRIRSQRFNVMGLPKELKKLGYRYIWMDLFCIPQTPRKPWSLTCRRQILAEWKERADDEIARQSQIFHGSAKCIAWLNDVSSWTAINLAIRWMGLHFLQQTGLVRIDIPSDTAQRSGFIEYEAHLDNEQTTSRGLRPQINIGWFTSLWTLQEAVLCPDMELCAADWSKLKDAWGTAISLRTIMLFIDQCGRFGDRKSWPEGALELSELEDFTHLSAIFITESPTVICSVTNTRTCSGPPQDRAPAIMSAIGVTDWWPTRDIPVINQFGEQEVPSQAVLNSYPLGFLQEAARKIGATLYHTVSHREDLHEDMIREMIMERSKLGTQVRDRNMRDAFTRRHDSRLGTMLPFRKPGSVRSWVPGSSIEFPHTDMHDHQSVSSWHICGDGSVRILKAGILLSSSQSHGRTERIVSNVYCSEEFRTRLKSEMDESDGQTDLDLLVALQVLARDGVAHAVTLYTEHIAHYGVILFGPRAIESTTQYYVKLGIYYTVEVQTPQTSVVDWIVL